MQKLSVCLFVCYRYSLMVDKCWDMDPENRATFFQLRRALEDLMVESKLQGRTFMDLEVAIREQLRGEF